MNGPIVIAAHGFREQSPTLPTHAGLRDFRAWSGQCRQRTGGFGDASAWTAFLAAEASTLQRFPEPLDPARPILTFDDALASVDLVADDLPAPAILFVVVSHVGKRNDWPGQPSWVPREPCLSWPRIRDLANRGWVIGAHTLSHPRLGRISLIDQRREIESSSKTIEDRLGLPCRCFAYPYGDAPATARQIVTQLGMIGFGTTPGRAFPRKDLACLPRVDLYDLVRPGFASGLAWSDPGSARFLALRARRALGSMMPRRSA